VLSTTLLLILVTAWALIRHLPKSARLYRSGIFLGTRTDKSIGFKAAQTRPELVDREGVAITDLRPSGVGLFDDERIDIVSESEWISQGTPVRIVAAEGYRHVVRSLQQATEEADEAIEEVSRDAVEGSGGEAIQEGDDEE
jgi:membrane-bound serine protease (ClpP class)